jgi:hypothetical protein
MTNNNSKTEPAPHPTRHLRRWMQVVGAFYVVQFVMMAVVRAPIRTFGPEGALAKAGAGDPLAEFLVDTWTTFGFEVAAVGITLLVATRRSELAKGVIWTVLAIEVGRGILLDSYMIARGIHVAGYLVWVAIHSVVIATGLRALRADRAGVDVSLVGSVPTHAAT